VVLSALMLLVELALIRWVGSNVIYLSYFSNFILLGSFLGIGLGFLRADARTDLFRWAPVGLALLVGFISLFPVKIDRSGSDLVFFGEVTKTGLPAWVTLPLIFLAVAAVMTMIAQGVARTFALFEPLEAYRLDICGSIIGIVVFSGLSFLRAPPLAWGVVAGALFVVLGIEVKTAVGAAQAAAIAGFVILLGVESLAPNDSWSPYYKVTTVPVADGSYRVDVNGIPHQAISSTEQRRRVEPLYFLPYERSTSKRLDDVLIVGAGNGTDVAIALQNAAGHVDAVEIDPRLYELGKVLQPNHPYQDPRVQPHIDDGRAFLHGTDRRYDTILFALPDSLTLVSGQSQLRLESFLFTKQALIEARDHLAPGGVFAMYNYYRERWLVDRLANTLRQVYGHAPCLDLGTSGHFALMTIGKDPGATSCPTTWVAFGANLLGAIAGGVLEYASLLIGYRSLLIGVALLYGLAFVTRPRRGAPVASSSH